MIDLHPRNDSTLQGQSGQVSAGAGSAQFLVVLNDEPVMVERVNYFDYLVELGRQLQAEQSKQEGGKK